MANGEKDKTIEMRLAAIEDKLSQMHVSEEEMKAYEKVAGLMGGPQAGGGTGGTQAISPILRNRFIIPRQIIRFCYECGGDCWGGGGGGGWGGGGGGGFGNFGG